MSKRIVYIAHPIGGNVEENLKDLVRILRIINTNSHKFNPEILEKKAEEWHNSKSPLAINEYMGISFEEYKRFVANQKKIEGISVIGEISYTIENFFDFSDVIPLAPYYADILSLDDNNLEERSRGLENHDAIIKTGIFDEMWLTGNKVSHGMNDEIIKFMNLQTPILNYVGKI